MQGSNNTKILRQNQTNAEKALWYQLRERRLTNYKFRRQVTIGHYVVDFVCMSARLIVELDGGQHARQVIYDEARTHYLQREGYEVPRFRNNEVLTNMEGVLNTLTLALSLRERG